MNAVRKFFANFQNHGAISGRVHNRARSLTDKASVLANEAIGTLEKQTDVDPLRINEELDSLQQKNKDDSVKVARLDSKESIKNIDVDLYPVYDTAKCLKEFDEILEEINRDFVEEDVSLDEIDDFLNCMTEKENVKEPLKPGIPKFDSQELQNEDIDPIYLDDFYLNESDIENIADPLDLNEIDKPDIVKTNDANLGTNNEASNKDYYIEINKNVQNSDVISISSEDSQAYDTNLNPEENKTNEANFEINKETSNKDYYIEINTNVQYSDVISISSEDSQAYESNFNTKDNKQIHKPKDDNEPEHVNDEYKGTDETRNVDSIEESDVNQNVVVTDVLNDCEEMIEDVIVELIKDELKNVINKSEETENVIDEVFNDSNNCELKYGSGENVNDEPKNVNKGDIMVTINDISEETENVIDEIFIDDSNNCELKYGRGEDVNDEPKNANRVMVSINDISEETKNVIDEVLNDSNNCELKFGSAENVNDEPKNVNKGGNRVSLNVKNEETENVIDEVFNDSNNCENVNNRDTVDSDDDCGYQSTDFEFITEDEAKMDGLIVNFDINTLKRKVSKPKRVKTLLDSSPLRIGSELKGKCHLNNLSASMQVNRARNVGSSLRNAGRHRPRIINRGLNLQKYKRQCRIKDSSMENKGFSPKHLQRDDLVHKNGLPVKCTEASHLLNNDSENVVPSNMQDLGSNTLKLDAGQGENETNVLKRVIGINSIGKPNLSQVSGLGFNVGPGPSNLQENEPVLHNIGHGPSQMQHRSGPSGLRNYPEAFDPRTERWRAFQNRNRNMFVMDHNNEDHRILSGEEYYGLFNPNFGPLPGRRLMENKCTLSTTMFVDYNGVGFDLQMMREFNESEKDEVKEEAVECARKILNMYPGENRKRRRF